MVHPSSQMALPHLQTLADSRVTENWSQTYEMQVIGEASLLEQDYESHASFYFSSSTLKKKKKKTGGSNF